VVNSHILPYIPHGPDPSRGSDTSFSTCFVTLSHASLLKGGLSIEACSALLSIAKQVLVQFIRMVNRWVDWSGSSMLVWFAYQSVPETSIPSNPFPSGLVYIGLATSTSGSTALTLPFILWIQHQVTTLRTSGHLGLLGGGARVYSKVHPTLSRGMRATR
jgi:hypothetical protein